MATDAIARLAERLAESAPKDGESIAQMRVNLENAASKLPLPAGITVREESLNGLSVERIVPAGAISGRIILYVHGGGFVLGSPATHRALAGRIGASSRAEVVSLDYRRAPEYPFPRAIEDVVHAVGSLISGWPEASIVLAGDSAGAGLAVAALVRIRDLGQTLPSAAVCLSPWVDLTLRSSSLDTNQASDPQVSRGFLANMAKTYLCGADSRDPLASPAYADLSGLPPILIQVGSAEVLLDDARQLAAAGARAGVDVTYQCWQDMFHVWHAFAPRLAQAQQAIDGVAEWLVPWWEPARRPAGTSRDAVSNR